MMIDTRRFSCAFIMILSISSHFKTVSAEENNSQRNLTPGIPVPEQYRNPVPIEKSVNELPPAQPSPMQYEQKLVIPPTVIDGRIKSVPQSGESIIKSSGSTYSGDQRVRAGEAYRIYACGRETPDLAVTLTNITGYKIDAQICFEKNNPLRWDCGVSYGIAPGKSWSHSACFTTGRYTYDSRGSNENVKFKGPPK